MNDQPNSTDSEISSVSTETNNSNFPSESEKKAENTKSSEQENPIKTEDDFYQNGKKYYKEYNSKFDDFFKNNIPRFPDGLKKFLVTALPYLNILNILLLIILAFSYISVFNLVFFASFAQNLPLVGFIASFGIVFWIVNLSLTILNLYLCIKAQSGLTKQNQEGYKYLKLSFWLSVLVNLFSLNIFGLIVGGFIGYWVLFEIKDFYSEKNN